MPSIKKRGKSFCIMVSMNYDMAGKQIRKTTTFTSNRGQYKLRKRGEGFLRLLLVLIYSHTMRNIIQFSLSLLKTTLLNKSVFSSSFRDCHFFFLIHLIGNSVCITETW